MTEMKIKDDKFYLLKAGEEKWIHDTRESAIQSLGEKISERKELNSDNVSIIEINPTKEKWKIEEIPWSEIAIKLIRGEK